MGITGDKPVARFIGFNCRSPQLTEEVDIEVIHPRTKYQNGRPTWLIENNKYKYIEVETETINLEYPLIVSAFYKDEKEEGVPADIIELKHNYDKTNLVLSKGDYIIVVKSNSGSKNYFKKVD